MSTNYKVFKFSSNDTHKKFESSKIENRKALRHHEKEEVLIPGTQG